jgi:hypothetical protein
MPYVKSVYRKDFESRTSTLTKEAISAQRLPKECSAIKDMVFQCAIFQTSAALEVYLKLLIEGWAFALKIKNKGSDLPELPRGFLVSTRLQKHFARYVFSGDEAQLLKNVPREYLAWPVFDVSFPLPAYFDGKLFHDKTAYPSFRNLKRLFFRVGIDKFQSEMDRLLRGDVETLVENFQSIRTALAHSAPPALTLADIKKNIRDIERLVRCIDRVFFRHVAKHGGVACWT